MTIQLPDDLGSSVESAVRSGRFGSAEELVATAVRSLLEEPTAASTDSGPDPFLGSMRDAVDELDAVVADAYRRRQEPWREIDVE